MTFAGPAHKSYIALCRELRLEREIREGDWWVDDLDGKVKCGSSMSEYLRNQPAMQMLPQRPDVVWVPTLADWLSMLEEAGYADVRIFREPFPTISPPWYTARRGRIAANDFTGEPACGPTREEAVAKLWMAVTGRTVTA